MPCKKCGYHKDAIGQYRMFGAQTTTNITLQILMVLLLIQAVYLKESMIIWLKCRGCSRRKACTSGPQSFLFWILFLSFLLKTPSEVAGKPASAPQWNIYRSKEAAVAHYSGADSADLVEGFIWVIPEIYASRRAHSWWLCCSRHIRIHYLTK